MENATKIEMKSQIELNRGILNDIEFNKKYQTNRIQSGNIIKSGINHVKKHYRPSKQCTIDFLLARFPLFSWLFKYDIKQNIVSDIISGITIGIVHIPQSMAYTMLSYLPTYVGLYVSIFPVILYVLFGTSKHLSMGTFAVPAIMTASAILKYEGILYPADKSHGKLAENITDFSATTEATLLATTTKSDPNFLSDDVATARIQISMCLTFLVGIIHVLFGILHVGFVTKYLSDSIVAGFTTGAAVHIVVSQIGNLLGYATKKPTITFKLVGAFIEIFKKITETNLASVIISIICIIILYLVKEQINHRFKDKMFMPVPIELIVVVFGTLFSYLFNFNEKWGVKIVGHVPSGIPAPQVPPLYLIPKLIGDAISIAIVTYAMNISMAKFFGKKYKYEISSNQELFAYGTGNILGSFFPSYPSCVSLSRCAILEATNAKSQIYAVLSTIVVILVVFFVGPLFRTLPNPCLSAIIVVALKGMVLQILQVPSVYRTSKMEALAWMATFLGVMILDVDIGLYIGIGFSLIMVIFKTQRPRISILGNIPNTEIYESIDICEQAYELNGIKIIRYEESLYYANVENFKYQITKVVGINLEEVNQKFKATKSTSKPKKLKKGLANGDSKNNLIMIKDGITNQAYDDDALGNGSKTDIREQEDNILNRLPVKHIILDCSSINFADSMGIDTIIQIKENYEQIGVSLHLTHCKPDMLKMLKKKSFSKKFDFTFIYPTTHDAVCAITDKTYLLKNKEKFEQEFYKGNTNGGLKNGHVSVVEMDDGTPEAFATELQKQKEIDAEIDKRHNFDEEYDIRYLSRF